MPNCCYRIYCSCIWQSHLTVKKKKKKKRHRWRFLPQPPPLLRQRRYFLGGFNSETWLAKHTTQVFNRMSYVSNHRASCFEQLWRCFEDWRSGVSSTSQVHIPRIGAMLRAGETLVPGFTGGFPAVLGFEPATSRSRGWRPSHYSTTSVTLPRLTSPFQWG